MLKNSKIGYNWIFQIVIGYYNWIFLISVFLSFVFFLLLLLLLVLLLLFFFLALKTTEGLFFQRVHLYLWAIAVNELNKLNIYEPRVLIAD